MRQQMPGVSEVNRLVSVWSIIESRQSLPAVILVTSATHLDDTEAIARGLAQVAHGAGRRTGYLRLGQRSASDSPALYAELTIAPRGSMREAFDASIEAWRTAFDVVFVDAGALGSESLGAHAARTGDGVVIGVRDQRRIVPADHDLARLLEELRARVFGVVLTAQINPLTSREVSRERSRLEAFAQQ